MPTIYDPKMMPEPPKRETCYAQLPNVYEVAECPKCEGRNITWSEFEGYIWCYDCGIDYIPEHWGIFDGPIPVEAARMMGISFDRIEIATGRLIPFRVVAPPSPSSTE